VLALEARRRCCRAGRSQATGRDDSWASSGDDSWPVVLARHCGHHCGPCAGVRGGGGSGAGSTADTRLPIRGEQRRDWTRGGRLGAMGWLKHSIPTGLSATKAANILEMLRGNEVRCGYEGEY
jgi:hypothetical protein